MNSHHNQVASVDEAQNQVIEELKKQNEDMKTMMTALTVNFEERLALQEKQFKQELARQDETILHQEKEMESLKREVFARIDDVKEIAENAIVSENGKKLL